ncbi:MAG: hypothetical protein ACR2FE_05685 [Aeromicrobium sp.]
MTIGHPPPHGRFVATALQWSGGWELHIEGEGVVGGCVTQVKQLSDAETQVRHYLETRYEDDFSDAVVEIVPFEGGAGS